MNTTMTKETTPENIEFLADDEVFIFGSNTKGFHGSGAALHAKRKFGAIQYFGEGLAGQSYAFPTLNADSHGGFRLDQRSDAELVASVQLLYTAARINSNKTFYLTKVGCGLAGYDEEYMKSLFMNSPSNIIKPEGW